MQLGGQLNTIVMNSKVLNNSSQQLQPVNRSAFNSKTLKQVAFHIKDRQVGKKILIRVQPNALSSAVKQQKELKETMVNFEGESDEDEDQHRLLPIIPITNNQPKLKLERRDKQLPKRLVVLSPS